MSRRPLRSTRTVSLLPYSPRFRSFLIGVGLKDLHYLVGDAIGALRPGVDHLVVLLTLSDQAVLILLLVLADQIAGVVDVLFLRQRHDYVVLAERDTGLEGAGKAERHNAIAEDDGLILAAMSIHHVDDDGD